MFKKIIAGMMTAFMFITPVLNAAPETIEMVMPAIEPVAPVINNSKEVSSSDKELTEAILKFKNVFGDTDMYDNFNHYISEYNGVKTYQLQWSNNSGESIYASVGANGLIYSYDYYNYSESSSSQLPNIFKDEALDIAYEFVKKVSPDAINGISKDYAEITLNRYQNKYSIVFYRVANGYLVNSETISVTVDQKEKITNYSRNGYSVNVKSPSEPKLTGIESITKTFNENLPFELAYKTIYPNGYGEKAEMKLVYVVNSDVNNHVVNAETGKLLKIGYQDYYAGSGQIRTEETAVQESTTAMDANYSLTEVESKAVELQKSFITVDDITKLLLGIDEFSFSTDYKVSGTYLYSSESIYTKKTTYYWSISYNTDDNKYASVIVNAETGEITSYYLYDKIIQPLKAETAPVYKYDEAVEYADKFLEKYYLEKFREYRLTSEGNPDSDSYYISYVRYVNDIMTNEYINVNMNLETYEITSLNINYTDATFPSPEKAITPEKAMEKYIALYGLEPKYITYIENKDDTIYYPSNKLSDTAKETMLVYTIDSRRSYIDAFTGKIIDTYNGNPVDYTPRKYYSSTAFTDIKDHKYEKEITMLSQMDIIVTDKDKFNPDAYITLNDFKEILSSATGGYYTYNERLVSISLPAGNLVTVKNESITRENAIIELIIVMGYSDVAKLKGIFNVDYFTDADSITETSIGYIALAKGMGLLDTFGEKLSPKTRLTRGEAAHLIYSYIVYEDVNK